MSRFGKGLEENVQLIDVEPFLDPFPRPKFENLKFTADGRIGPDLPSNQWNTFLMSCFFVVKNFFTLLPKRRLAQTKWVLRNRIELTFGELRKLVEKRAALNEEIN